METKSILVTGGAGFIGSNIVEYLLNLGVKYVRIIDNLSTGKKSNIELMLKKYSNLEFMYGDISNLESCRNAVKDIDIICHQAALGSVPRSVSDPLSSHISNVNGFLNILIAAKETGIKRIVYASSSSVYGDNLTLPKVEENTGNVLSPYAATKAIDEIYGNVFTKCYGMECIGLRYFNIFGPRQDPNGAYAAVIPKFIQLMNQNKIPTINGDGSYSRDFTYVTNAVEANVLAMFTTNSEAFGDAFNIGCGDQYSLNELVELINFGLNKNIISTYGELRPGDIPHSNADISKANKILNYKPKIKFNEGIKKTLEYFDKKKNKKVLLIENIDFNKLLSRELIEINNLDVKKYLNNNIILITGGCGSIGSEVVRQLLEIEVHNLVIYDNYECGIFNLKNEINKRYKSNNVKYVLGDIKDITRLENTFDNYKPIYVFHCAAYKHVNIVELNPQEAVRINIIGTKNVSDLSIKHGVKKFLMVSTDKAVNPTSVMGYSKRIAEIYASYLNTQQKNTEFVIIRFGNVLGSSGSVIPTFISNINNDEPIKITHPEIIRYFMTMPEAAKLILQASMIGNAGEIMLFDMGKPVKIYDLAKKMIELYSEKKIDIIFTNLEKGEKLYEELLCKDENIIPTENKKIMKLKNSEHIDYKDFICKFNKLINNYFCDEEIINLFKKIVCNYQKDN
jgi:UDP-N-acetylglucosamine 4-epimerase